MILSVACANCNKEFQTRDDRLVSGRGKYCSISCRGMARRAIPIPRLCHYCGKEFNTTSHLLKISKGWYCSRSCFVDDRRGKETMPFGERLVKWIRFPAISGDCAIWVGDMARGGYGKISKLVNGKCVSVRAHRAVYEFYFGPILPTINVLHTCDNPSCCNILHLFIGSHQDNVKDKVTKNRHAKGEAMGSAKLTTRNVLIIKTLLLRGRSLTDIARMFGVTVSAIYSIRHGKTWKHIP